MEPEQASLAVLQQPDGILDGASQRGAVDLGEQRGLGIGVRGQRGEHRIVFQLEAVVATLEVQREAHRGDPHQRAEIAAARELGDPRRCSDEQLLADLLLDLVDRIAVEPHASEHRIDRGEVASFERPDRGRIAGGARTREVQLGQRQLGERSGLQPSDEVRREAVGIDLDPRPCGTRRAETALDELAASTGSSIRAARA